MERELHRPLELTPPPDEGEHLLVCAEAHD